MDKNEAISHIWSVEPAVILIFKACRGTSRVPKSQGYSLNCYILESNRRSLPQVVNAIHRLTAHHSGRFTQPRRPTALDGIDSDDQYRTDQWGKRHLKDDSALAASTGCKVYEKGKDMMIQGCKASSNECLTTRQMLPCVSLRRRLPIPSLSAPAF
jgi:hypothetical protein